MKREAENAAWIKSYPERAEKEFYLRDGTFDILDDITPEDNLVRAWTEYGTKTQDAYPEYHTAAMLVLISHLFPATMKPQYASKGVNNNMWCIILGNSGCGKSMACGAAVSLAYEEKIMPYFSRISNKFTPESLTQSLSESRRRFHYSNEAVGFLKNMKRDYAGELPEDITNAYDGERVSKQTMKMGIVSCDHPLYSGLWNTTIDSWSKNATEDGFASGMFMRPFFIISTRAREIKKDSAIDPKTVKIRTDIVDYLADLLGLVHGDPVDGQIYHPKVIVFAESEYINNWKYGLRVDGNNGKYSELEQSTLQRVFDQARKIAMNLTIASSEFMNHVMYLPPYKGNLPVMNDEIHYEIPDYIAEYACYIAECVFWKNSIKALKATYSTGVYSKVMRALEGNKKLTKSEIGDMVNLHGKHLTEVLDDLGLSHKEERILGKCRPVTYYWK